MSRSLGITLKDAICLVHPKPKTEEQSILFKKVLDDKLETPYTWEVELSKAGQEKRDKKEVWEELIDSGKMGYQAQLRNLRNFVQNDVSKQHIIKVGDLISDAEQVRKSKQFPFRFLSAYRALNETIPMNLTRHGSGQKEMNPLQKYLASSLEKALKVSVENLELFKNTDSVLIASDVSGSMMTHQSEKSTITMMDIGLLLSMILNNKCSFVTAGMFGDTFKTYNLPTSQILSNVDEMYKREGEVGYATNGYKVLEYALKSKHSYDKICMFTDGQMYGHSNMQGLWNEYKKINQNAKMYLFNLAGYGGSMPLQIEKNDVYLISGWSSEIFNVLYNLEKGGKVLDEINKISL